ncbi:hypothetical protein Tco_0832479 [Tanacetum coccineum]
MEAAIQQYHVDKQCNDRLLYLIISQDIVNSSVDVNTSVKVNSYVIMNDSVNYVEMCNKDLELEAELIKQHNMVEKDEYNRCSKRFSELEQHCISLEIAMQLNKEIFQKTYTSVNQTEPSFDQLFELNNLKVELQAKDTTIKKLKEHIKRINETSTSESVNKDFNEIETINIELEYRVTRLIAENEHLKQTYKQLYDSIKPSRVRAKEQTESLVNQVNQKFVEISDLNAQLQEKHTMEKAAILREVVEQAKSRNPLDSASYSACMYVKLIQELLGVNPSTSASGSKPSSNTKNDRILRTPNKWNPIHLEDQILQLLHPLLLLSIAGCPNCFVVFGLQLLKTHAGDHSQLTNFVHKFLGRGHNLFSVGQFCDSDLVVAFRKHTCFVCNLKGVDLLSGSRGTNLYSLSIGDMMAYSPIRLL